MEKLQASSESVVFVGIQLPVDRESRVVTNFERRKEFAPISVFPPEENKNQKKKEGQYKKNFQRSWPRIPSRVRTKNL
jgi:hypothetical protein